MWHNTGHTPMLMLMFREETVAKDRTRNSKITAPVMLVAAVAVWVVDVVVNDFNLFIFGVFALAGVASYFAWKNPREKNAASLGVLGVGIITFALAVFGIDGTRAIGAGLMLGSGFLLLLHSIEPVKPARWPGQCRGTGHS